MLRRCLLVVLCVLFLWPIGPASGDLVGWWPFDETGGSVARDGSSNGNDGTVVGTAVWAPGHLGGALQFDGSTYVNCGTSNVFNITDAVTLAAWVQPDADFAYPDWSGIIMRGGPNIDTFALYYNGPNRQLGFKTTGATPEWFASGANAATVLFDGDWHHVAATYDGAIKIIYVDGVPLANAAATGRIETSTGRLLLGAGRDLNPPTHHVVGKMDDAQIYDLALTQVEIQRIMKGLIDKSLAHDPSPKDGAGDVLADAVLNWTPGVYAGTHDVYFGTIFADVNDAGRASPRGVLVSQGQTATEFGPADLDYGQVYYWRVDEINATPDGTIFKGETWSFTAEPLSYPVQPAAATASSAQPGMDPENTINGSGLNDNDEHSTELTDMWMSGGAQPHWIQYEFDRAYKFDKLLVWNSNQIIETFLGFGARNVTVEYSVDGEIWTALDGVPEFAKATAVPTYQANTTVEFGGVAARFVKLTINQNWGGMAPQSGLSEVRFFSIPVQARAPQPADEAKDVSIDTDLSWRPGREAQSHEVYFGTAESTMSQVATLAVHSYTPASLEFGTTYFWKVNEIGGDGPYEGEVWGFTTQEFAVVEDFEGYNDDDHRIYDTWIDGWVNNTGSQVGYDVSPFAEQTIVHGGRQSMPLTYDNTGGQISETTRTFEVAQNWTAGGIESLSLWFYGAPANTGQLYVKINNTRVLYNGGAADLKREQWQPWNIDLTTVGGANKVTELTIGIESTGATGIVYLDDIRLYPKTPELLTLAEPR